MALELGQIIYIYPFDQPAFGPIAVICLIMAIILLAYAAMLMDSQYLPHLTKAAIAACLGLMFLWSNIAILGNIYTAVIVPKTIATGEYLSHGVLVSGTFLQTTSELVPMVTGTVLTESPILLISMLIFSATYLICTLTILVRWKNTTARVRARRHTNAG